MVYQKYIYSDIEALGSDFSESYQTEVYQLDSGDVGEREVAALPSMTLHYVRHDATLRFVERPVMRGVGLWVVDESPRCVQWRGEALGDRDLVVQQGGHEYDYILPAGSQGAMIELDYNLSRELGFGDLYVGPIRCSRRMLDQLSMCVRGVIRACRHRGGEVEAEQLFLWQAEIVRMIRKVIGDWELGGEIAARVNGGYAVISLASEWMRAQGAGGCLDKLAQELEISPRTLNRLFHRWAGMGPGQYLSIMRMHALRRALIGADVQRGAVKEYAYALGYQHLGNMAQRYKELFGESPSETVRR
ncbi:helix-turn-helix domain-containing protein [Rubritalea tangerina]|uniref:Helix-turn-helix domain-containing protein n=1 Tax=Rubritalea tangerina TaxID=430798 RepID=A0ABW4ZB97_9BACT